MRNEAVRDLHSALRTPHSALVMNPRATAGSNAKLWQRAASEVRRCGNLCGELATRGDGDVADITRFVRETRPAIVVAAGGDGTVSEVVQAIMAAGVNPQPALAIMPLGTANDIARSFGLWSFRQRGGAAVERAVTAWRDGRDHRIDLGHASTTDRQCYFAGSFALGMDADILAMRNRLRRRFHLGRRLSGYPLYLWSCGANVLARSHGGDVRLRVDGAEQSARFYNLLVTNTPQYAGEFRFDADNSVDDGRLDLHLFAGGLDYLRRYPAAWRRHVHYHRDEPVAPPGLQRVRELQIELTAPLAAQLDGEEWGTASSFTIRAVPNALVIRVPPPSHQSRVTNHDSVIGMHRG